MTCPTRRSSACPGGWGTRDAMSDERILDWIRDAHETSEWTTSVCTGSLLLGAAGVLEGLDATSHWLELETLAELGATPTGRRVVEQGKVVTAAGVSSGIDMALILLAKISGEEYAKTIQLLIEYDPQPPFDAGSPEKAPPETVAQFRELAAARVPRGRSSLRRGRSAPRRRRGRPTRGGASRSARTARPPSRA